MLCRYFESQKERIMKLSTVTMFNIIHGVKVHKMNRLRAGILTHLMAKDNKEAEGICSTVFTQGCYTFKPAQKLGKQYGDDSLPLRETYRHIERQIFSKIPRSSDNPVFHGYYSWCEVSVTE